MEIVRFIIDNLDIIGTRTIEHISIVFLAVGIAIATAVPIGVAITQSKSTADTVLYLASMMITVPSIALFGLMIPLLSPIGHGIGYVPAVVAVILYSQLPIIRNTYTAITNVDPALREAAKGMGMSTWQRLRQVEIPLAIPVIMAGVRTAVVMNIGVTAIAAYIGAGGLGTFISRGISQSDPRQLVTGALAVSLLAIAADLFLALVQRLLTSRGIQGGGHAMIRLENLTKHYGPAHDPLIAVDNVSLDLPTGEICVLLGPSGCGKTTTMKMINRLIQPTSGKVFINGKDTSTIDPIKLRRTIGYVIQQIGLFPNKTIEENICVVPDLLGWDRRKSRARAKELLELVGLQPDLFLKRYPKELSGGQQQRVGVLRALAADPPVMLMDEPFGAIDPINREAIQEEFLKMQREIRKTIIFVSHDLDEAVKMADKIAIFRSGRLEQYAAPDELLARPANSFIEDFLGSDRALKRLRLVSVRDAMETGFITVRSSDSVEHALERMRSSRSAAVFVLNADGAPQSLLSEQVAELRSGTVGDHAEPVKSAVPTTGDLRQAVSIMFAHDMPLLPCVDEGGRMAGVMSYRSIVHYLAHGAKA